MKFLAISLLLVTITAAEPPVDNRYLPPQQGFGQPSQTYGAPNPGFGRRQTDAVFRPRPSQTYNAPSPRRPANQYIPPTLTAPGLNPQALSNQYLPPSRPSNQYSAPNPRLVAPQIQGLNQQSGFVPEGAGQLGNQRLLSQYLPPNRQAQRPSTEYGPPSMIPSGQYGAPGFEGNQLGSGSSYDSSYRNGGGYGGDEQNGEPANYSFEYMVRDAESGNDFGHREARQGDRAVGTYYALLPDGRKQTVEYEADKDGYRPIVSYEDTGLANGGYNRNAQESNQGGYDGQGPY